MSNCRVPQSFNSLNLFIFRQTCNTVNGTYDGSLFPKNVTKNEKFKMYRKAFCRLFPIYFSHAGKLHGIDAYWFELSENAFYDQSDDDDTSCFCESENSCLRKGLGNIAPCYFSKQKIQLFKKGENCKNFHKFSLPPKDIPMAVSQPHYFNGDPALLNEVDGMRPDGQKHQTTVVIQPVSLRHIS